MKKRFLSMALTTAMVLSAFGGTWTVAAEEAVTYPEYLNMDSYYPLIKEGNDVSLRVVVIEYNEYWDNPEERYFWNLVETKMNLDVEVEQISSEGAEEYISMLFASDDLPDILITKVPLTKEQLVTYGVEEGQLLDFAPYVNDPVLMPNLNAAFEQFPALKGNMTAGNGGIYSQITVADSDGAGIYDVRHIDSIMLEELGLEAPTTLDAFVDMLYKVKEAHPEMTPLGGSYNYYNPSGIILNALGYNDSASTSIYDVAVRNNAPVVPAADKEAFAEYLEIMSGFFADGIISSSFYTMEKDAAEALVKEGKTAVYTGRDYWAPNYPTEIAIPPLTSEYSEEPVIGRKNLYSVGNVVASAKTEHPELVSRLLDFFYSQEGRTLYTYGPCVTQTDLVTEKCPGWGLTEEISFFWEGIEYASEEYFDNYYGNISCGEVINGIQEGWIPYLQEVHGNEEIFRDYDNWVKMGPEAPYDYWRVFTYDTYKPLATDGLPNLYFDGETSIRLGELKSVLKNYMETEVTKFVTGSRPLSEVDAYFAELEDLGYAEYIGYYQEAYDAYLQNQ